MIWISGSSVLSMVKWLINVTGASNVNETQIMTRSFKLFSMINNIYQI